MTMVSLSGIPQALLPECAGANVAPPGKNYDSVLAFAFLVPTRALFVMIGQYVEIHPR